MSGTAHEKAISVIRFGTNEDANLLATLGSQTFHDTFADQNKPEDMAVYLSEAFSPSKQAAELDKPNVIFLIAESAEVVQGYAKLQSGSSPACIKSERSIEIARIYVVNDWIGKGIGANLMRRCLDEAKERGFVTIWLGVWERNERAQRFYRDWGFKVVGEQSFQLGSDLQNDYVMERAL